MKFAEILEYLKNGKRVRRESLNPWELYELNVGQAKSNFECYALLLVTTDGKNYGGKNITSDDLLATDWEVIDDNPKLRNIEDLDVYEIRKDGTWIVSIRCAKYIQNWNCNIEHCFYDEVDRPIAWCSQGNRMTIDKVHGDGVSKYIIK